MRRRRLNSGYSGNTDQRRTIAGTISMSKHNMERNLGSFLYVDGWNPEYLTTSLWLDASDINTITLTDGVVSQWRDKSGNERNATQATPSNRPGYIPNGMNSLGLVDWDGSNDAMTISGTVGGQLKLHELLSEDNTYSMAWVVKPDVISNEAVLLYVPENSWKFLIEIKKDGGLYWGANNPNYRAYSGGSFFVAHIGTFFTLIKTGSGLGTAHVAGTFNNTFSNNGGGLSNTPPLGQAFILGQYPGIFYDGKMAEIIISNYSWHTSERQLIEGYLAHKWGLSSSLPSDHPYKNFLP